MTDPANLIREALRKNKELGQFLEETRSLYPSLCAKVREWDRKQREGDIPEILEVSFK